MAKLFGAQRMVLLAILDLPKDAAGYVTDFHIAQRTQIAIADVRDWIETLDHEGHVEVARAGAGLGASITASGRLALGQYQPFSPHTPAIDAPQPTTVLTTPMETPSTTPTETTGQAVPGPSIQHQPIRLFYSYSHKDETLRDELEEALALLKR